MYHHQPNHHDHQNRITKLFNEYIYVYDVMREREKKGKANKKHEQHNNFIEKQERIKINSLPSFSTSKSLSSMLKTSFISDFERMREVSSACFKYKILSTSFFNSYHLFRNPYLENLNTLKLNY